MKTKFYSFLFLCLGLLGIQNASAQEETVIYTANFEEGYNGWEAEGDFANQGLWDASQGALTAYGYMSEDKLCTGYMVSPIITLGASNNTASFDHQGFYFNDMSQEALLLVREVNGEWVQIEGINYPTDFSRLNSGKLTVPSQFDGKDVQFAFEYKMISTATIGNWFIFNFEVVTSDAAPVEKEEAGLSYDVTEVKYSIGDGEFQAPVLNNPNNLEVFYSSENESVAIVDETGNVTIQGMGTALIRALSLPTEKYKKGEASYIITVTDPNVALSASFAIDDCGFIEETTAINTAWMHMDYEKCMMADAYEKVEKMTDFYLISPEFTLNAEGNVLTFTQMTSYFTDIENQAMVLVREVGGEWIALNGITYPIDEGVAFHNSGDITIPAELNGKNVQIAFKYVSDGIDNSGIWYIKDVIVKKAANGGGEEATPEVLFEESFTTNHLGDFVEETTTGENIWDWFFITNSARAKVADAAADSRLVSPEVQLMTKNTIAFSYRADSFTDLANEVFVSVREVGGEWTDIVLPVINNDMAWTDTEVEVPAEFDNKNVQIAFRYAAANGTFCVKNVVVKGVKGDVHTGIDSVTSKNINDGKIYDLQGRVVNNPSHGLYIINGKKVIIK